MSGEVDRPSRGQIEEVALKVRYFGREDVFGPTDANGKPRIEVVYRGEFDENEMFWGEYAWQPHLNKWVDTRAVSAMWFMGEGNLVQITEQEAMDFIEANRARDENGQPIDGVKLMGIAEYLLQLPPDAPWILDFSFGQWQDHIVNDDIVGYCQVLRLDDNNWCLEFSSDEFNNPKLTERQKKAILDAGFAEPNPDESPNYSLEMADPTAELVVARLERVLNEGGFVD